MHKLLPETSSKQTIILGVITFIILVIYVISLLLYPDIAIRVYTPGLFLWLAGLQLYQGIKKLQNKENGIRGKKWYKEYNIILAFAWILGFALFPFYYLVPLGNFVVVQSIGVGLFFISMIMLLIYAFFLYRRRNEDNTL